MAPSEVSESESDIVIVYDPVRIGTGSLFDRIDLEDILDSDNNNPETGRPFDMYDIQPQHEIRMQMRQRVTVVGQNMLLRWSVIEDYPVEILDESHMSDYVNSLAHSIANDISLPRDLKILWKSLNLLRLNCQYSDVNKRLFRSVKGFVTLVETLSRYFDRVGLRRTYGEREYRRYDERERDTENICREILKLAEITDFSEEDGDFIFGTQSLTESFIGIMRTVLFAGPGRIVLFEGGPYLQVGRHKKDVRRIVRIMEVTCNNPQIHHIIEHDYFGYLIYQIMGDLTMPSVDIIRCVDIAYAYCSETFDRQYAGRALFITLKVLVDRFLHSAETNANFYGARVDEEYSDRSAALEKVLKIWCQLFVKYGAEVVSVLVPDLFDVKIKCWNLILNYALLHPEEGEGSLSGKHLLYAMIMNKYIFESTAAHGHGVLMDDIKVVFDFAMSSLPGRYLFNGRPRLKELTDQVIDTMLNLPHCQSVVLQHWNEHFRFPFLSLRYL